MYEMSITLAKVSTVDGEKVENVVRYSIIAACDDKANAIRLFEGAVQAAVDVNNELY